jgi:uncharacterized SAM-binding protein YcdF (DUF218 family)
MLVMGRTMSGTGRDTQNPAQTRAPRRRSFLSIFFWSLAGALIVGLGAGFYVFISDLPVSEARTNRSADGIVVLTGGALRIADAVELLAEKRGQRLLISGVNPATKPEELKKQIPDFARLSECCIDLGHAAQNTAGNAVETAAWARKHSFRSLLVVTSAWHMPRALLELGREMPDIALVPYPVVTERMREQSWWSDPQTMRLLVFEYLKYLATLARI